MKKQMKKQLSASIVCLCLLLLMFVGSSLAWFTDTHYTYDVMTTANVSIEHTVTNDANNPTVFYPGVTYNKTVTVENTSTTVSDCYARTLFAFEDNAEGTIFNQITTNPDVPYDAARFVITCAGVKYYYVVGSYVHGTIASGNTTDYTCTITADGSGADNAWAALVGPNYDTIVLTQACQVEGLGNDAGAALNVAFGSVNAANSLAVGNWFKEAFAHHMGVAVDSITVEAYTVTP